MKSSGMASAFTMVHLLQNNSESRESWKNLNYRKLTKVKVEEGRDFPWNSLVLSQEFTLQIRYFLKNVECAEQSFILAHVF